MKIIDKYGNPFLTDKSLKCQCIPADLAMNTYIAEEFNKYCNTKNQLETELNLNKKQLIQTFYKSHGFCIYYNGVFNLITKAKMSDKSTYDSLNAALQDMSKCIKAMNEMGFIPNKKIVIPEVNNNFDGLEWEKVKKIMEVVFHELDVELEIWHYDKQSMKNLEFEIKTGYFALTKCYEEAGYYPVSIAQYTPQRIVCGKAQTFAPPKDLLHDYKNGMSDDINYENRYKKYLDSIPKDTWNKFISFYEKKCYHNGYKGIVLMCYEKPDDFCHRHIFADYVNEKFGIKVEELTPQKKLGEDKTTVQSPLQEEYER